MATFSNQKRAKKSQLFLCNNCDYTTQRKTDFERHTHTDKHKSVSTATFSNHCSHKNAFLCTICGKSYQDKSGLWRHKKKCDHNNEVTNVIEENNDGLFLNLQSDSLIEILKQNNEFKELIIEQNKQNQELTKHLIEISKNPSSINTNCNNNTMNNKFNLNVFLNEQCKDAININDFVKSLQITSADFERFGKNGFVEGISNIMVKGLNKLELCKRPIHCSDLKRETIHLKEDNGWTKETDDGSKLKKVIKQIKHKNIDYTDAWKEENPEYKDFESKVHERYMKIINESMGGYNIEEDEVFYNKIIKNVAKETVIKKSEVL